jgi:NADH-quinone oxidoreductase subunit L
MTIPLVILAALSLVGGFVEMPENILPVHLFSGLINTILPVVNIHSEHIPEWVFQVLSGLITLAGIFIAWRLFYKTSAFRTFYNNSRINNFFYSGWGFDRVYDAVFVRPFVWLSEKNKNDFIDKVYGFLSDVTGFFNSILSHTQNGRLRWYAMGLTAGLVILLSLMMAL